MVIPAATEKTARKWRDNTVYIGFCWVISPDFSYQLMASIALLGDSIWRFDDLEFE
jgi:hypothetical protein